MKLILILLVACSSVTGLVESPMVYINGVPNLDQVEVNIWRSGQITTQQGWDYVAKLAAGRTVHVVKLNFDHEGSDALAVAMGFDVAYLPIQPEGDRDAWDDVLDTLRHPDEMQVAQAEDKLAYCQRHPDTDVCLGHCTHGQDRTGYVFGKHRVLHDGWTKGRAYEEMLAHHFHPLLRGIRESWEGWSP